jgi:hypothetical protein
MVSQTSGDGKKILNLGAALQNYQPLLGIKKVMRVVAEQEN